MIFDFPVLFYDGDCGFCNRSVQFVLDHEKSNELHFCALQSEKAKVFFKENNFAQPDLSTFYFWNEEKLFERSTAALKVSGYLGFPWNLAGIFIIIPRFIRDGVYNWIAKRRHKLAAGSCAFPTQEQRKRFIN